MSLVYLTGTSGSGKSAVLRELSKQGFEAHGVDEEGFADWVDREAGVIVPFPHDDPSLDIHDWYRKHRWVLSKERTFEFGKDPEEMALIVSWLPNYDETYRGFGALVIDATKPLDQVVSEILQAV